MSDLASPNGLVADKRAAINQTVVATINDAQAQLEGVGIPEPVIIINDPDGITMQVPEDPYPDGITIESSEISVPDPDGMITSKYNNTVNDRKYEFGTLHERNEKNETSQASNNTNNLVQSNGFEFVGGSSDYGHFAKIIIDIEQDDLTKLAANFSGNILGTVEATRIVLPMDSAQELSEQLSVSFSRSMGATANMLVSSAEAGAALVSPAVGAYSKEIGRRMKIKYDSSSLAKRLNIPFVVYVNDRDTFEKIKKCIAFLEALLYPVGPSLLEISPPVSVTIGKLYTRFKGNLAGVNIRYETSWTTDDGNSAFMVDDSFPLFIRGTLDFVNLALYMWSGLDSSLNLSEDPTILFGTSEGGSSGSIYDIPLPDDKTLDSTVPPELLDWPDGGYPNAPAAGDSATVTSPKPAKTAAEIKRIEKGEMERQSQEEKSRKKVEQKLEQEQNDAKAQEEQWKKREQIADDAEKYGDTEFANEERDNIAREREMQRKKQEYKEKARAEYKGDKGDGYDYLRRERFEEELNNSADIPDKDFEKEIAELKAMRS